MLFPKYTLESTYHDTGMEDETVYDCLERYIYFKSEDAVLFQNTGVMLKNEAVPQIRLNNKTLAIESNAVSSIKNNSGETIGVEIDASVLLDLNEIRITADYYTTGTVQYVDATTTATFNSYNDIQIWVTNERISDEDVATMVN